VIRTACAGLAIAGLARISLGIAALPSCSALNNAGTDGGADAAASTATAGDQCTKIETAFCMRSQACAIPIVSLSQCVADGNVTCCGSKCSAASSTTEQSVSVCVEAVTNLDCNSLATGATPQACAGIPKTN
jgi:hypothetical protein